MKEVEIRNIEPEYVHSSNTVFSFMNKAAYLEKAISEKRLSPRYCKENIEYLNLMYDEKRIDTILVLQKCFCDIPLHSIAEHFPLSVLSETSNLSEDVLIKLKEGSTHTDFYGEYGIGFSKTWAQSKNLQPVQYINPKSAYAEQFKSTFEFLLNQDDVDDLVVSDIIARLAYFKPLYGEMTRVIDDKEISVLKNFHDECEWRFVPRDELLEQDRITAVVFDEEMKKRSSQISDRLSERRYNKLGLNYEYQDISYLIVPNNAARKQLIDYIMMLELGTDNNEEKYLLISKILVLENIKKDF